MMLLCGQSNRVWHYWAGRYPGSVGMLLGPAYWRKVPLDKWMPFALDNDAFMAWRDNKPWNECAWLEMLRQVKLTGRVPLWVAVPDVVTNRTATLHGWRKYADVVLGMGWNPAFCVQDGMAPDDVPGQAKVVFVGGSDGWKFPNLPMWCEHFGHVHCARVNAPEMIEACERVGCKSVDGTGWFRDPDRQDKLPALERFIEGHRNGHVPVLAFEAALKAGEQRGQQKG